jgi:hypothetical protein
VAEKQPLLFISNGNMRNLKIKIVQYNKIYKWFNLRNQYAMRIMQLISSAYGKNDAEWEFYHFCDKGSAL